MKYRLFVTKTLHQLHKLQYFRLLTATILCPMTVPSNFRNFLKLFVNRLCKTNPYVSATCKHFYLSFNIVTQRVCVISVVN